ncbi:MAG TPA: hypothetical protein DIU37_05905 [Opitutae bacterium]|nr:hypothetical protein [Opitutae bacterium]
MRKTNVVWVGFLFFFSTNTSFGGGFWHILFPPRENPDEALRAYVQQLLASLHPQQVVEVDESILNNDDIEEDNGIAVVEVDDTVQAQALEDALFALHRYLAWQALYTELRIVLTMDDELAPQVAGMLIQAFCNGLCCSEQVRARLLRLDPTEQLAGDEATLIELLTDQQPLNRGVFQELIERLIDAYQGIVERYLDHEANIRGARSLMHFLLGAVVEGITTELREGNEGDEAPVLMGMNFNTQVLVQIQRWADRYDPHFHLWQHADLQHQRRLFGSIRNYRRHLPTRRDWVLAQLLQQFDEVVEPAKEKDQKKKSKNKGKRSANKEEDRVYDDEEIQDGLIILNEEDAEDENMEGITVIGPNRDRSNSESSEEDDEVRELTIVDEEGNELQRVNLASYHGRNPSELLSFTMGQIEEQHRNTLRLGEVGAPIPVQDLWLTMPPELWFFILEYLDFDDLLNASRVCMFLHGLTICPNWQRLQNVLNDGSVQTAFRSESQRNLFTRLGLRFLEKNEFRKAARCFAIQGCFEGLILPHNYGGLCHVGHYLNTLQGANPLSEIVIPACQQERVVGNLELIIANPPDALAQQALLNAIAEHYFNREIVLPRFQQIALDSTQSLKRRIRALVHWQTLLHQCGDTRVPPIEEIWDLHSMALVMGVPFEQAEALINTLKQLCLRFKKAKNAKAKNFVTSILWDLLLIAQSTRAIEPLRLLALDAFGDLVEQFRPSVYNPFIDTMTQISISENVPIAVRNKALFVLMKMTRG